MRVRFDDSACDGFSGFSIQCSVVLRKLTQLCLLAPALRSADDSATSLDQKVTVFEANR